MPQTPSDSIPGSLPQGDANPEAASHEERAGEPADAPAFGALARGKNRKPSVLTRPSRSASFYLCCCALLLGASIWVFGHRQFGGFDQSVLVDTGWRLFRGQIPYHDFYLTTPVSFYVGAELALRVFGVGWSAFVAAAIVFSAVTFFAHVAILRQLLTPARAIAVAMTCQLLAMVVTSYWWYNATAIIAFCLFMTSILAFVFHPTRRSIQCSVVLSLSLLFLMKPNIAGMGTLFLLAVLLLRREYRRTTLIMLGVSIAVTLIALFALRIAPTDVLSSYLGIALSRAKPSLSLFFKDKPEEAFVTIPLLVLCLAPLLSALSRGGLPRSLSCARSRTASLVLLGGLVVGFLSFITNSDSNLVVGMPILLLSSSLAAFLLSDAEKRHSDSNVVLGFGVALAVAVVLIGLLVRSELVRAGGVARPLSPARSPGVALWQLGTAFSAVAVALGVLRPSRKQAHSEAGDSVCGVTTLLSRLGRSGTVFWVAVVVCSCIAFYAGNARWRVKYIGPFYDAAPLVEISEAGFFKGLRAGAQLQRVLEQVRDSLVPTLGSGERMDPSSVFFGPRMEFAYAAFGLDSPRHLPVWWHPGNSFPEGKVSEVTASFVAQRFSLCVFLRPSWSGSPDFTYMPRGVVQELERSYRRMDYADIVVFSRS